MRRAIGLGDEKAAAQIGVENQVPIVPGDIERGLADVAAGVVDQDVNLAEGGLGFCSHALDAVLVAHIEFERKCAPAKGLDLRFEAASMSSLARLVRTRSAPALASARAKYCPSPRLVPVTMRNLAGQIEERVVHGSRPQARSRRDPRVEHDLHQVRLARVQALEPARALVQAVRPR